MPDQPQTPEERGVGAGSPEFIAHSGEAGAHVAVDDLKVTVWVNVEWYLSVSDEDRAMFVAGATDMLAAMLPTIVPEHSARLRAMVGYANALDNNAIRDLLDRFIRNGADRQKEDAASQLLTALNYGSGFGDELHSHTKRSPFWHPICFTNRITGREWRPKPGTAIAYYALLLTCALLIGVGVVTVTRAIGLGVKEVRIAVIFSIILGFVFFDYPMRALTRRIHHSGKVFARFFHQVRTPPRKTHFRKTVH